MTIEQSVLERLSRAVQHQYDADEPGWNIGIEFKAALSQALSAQAYLGAITAIPYRLAGMPGITDIYKMEVEVAQGDVSSIEFIYLAYWSEIVGLGNSLDAAIENRRKNESLTRSRNTVHIWK